EANLNAAEHQVDQSRAAVQEARDNLRKTHITAPMAGRVTRLAVEEGEVAVPGTFSKDVGLLLTVSDLSVIPAKVRVDETELLRAQEARIGGRVRGHERRGGRPAREGGHRRRRVLRSGGRLEGG